MNENFQAFQILSCVGKVPSFPLIQHL